MSARGHLHRSDRVLLCADLLAPWVERLAVQGYRPIGRTISLNQITGRMRVTATFRANDGTRVVLRVTKQPDRDR